METTQIISLVLTILGIVGLFLSYYFYIKGEIIKAANGAVDEVEKPDAKGKGQEKLKEATEKVYVIVPAILKPFISKGIVEKIVQSAFDKIESYAKKQAKKDK